MQPDLEALKAEADAATTRADEARRNAERAWAPRREAIAGEVPAPTKEQRAFDTAHAAHEREKKNAADERKTIDKWESAEIQRIRSEAARRRRAIDEVVRAAKTVKDEAAARLKAATEERERNIRKKRDEERPRFFEEARSLGEVAANARRAYRDALGGKQA